MSVNVGISASDGTVNITVNESMLTIRLPDGIQPVNLSDALIAATFFPAMTIGSEIRVGGAFQPSQRVREQNLHLQDVFCRWVPSLKRTTLPASQPGTPTSRPGVLSLFSGGVDSIHTLICNQEDITHLLHVTGFEHDPGSDGDRSDIQHLQEVADRFGKTLLVVDTNSLEFYRGFSISREVYCGSLFAAIAHLLGFEKLLVPSSDHYGDLGPLGSHPLTDPMWGSEKVSIEHHGGACNRQEKTAQIAEHPFARHYLHVCERQISANCGVCGKCIRTNASLKVVGASSRAFPSVPIYRLVASARFRSPGERWYFEEIIEEALSQKDHRMVRGAAFAIVRVELRERLRGFARRVAHHADRVVLGGRIRSRRLERRARQPRQENEPTWHGIYKFFD